MYLILAVSALVTAFFIVECAIPTAIDLMTDKDVAPDRPWPFGYRTAWLAIRSDDHEGVIDALGLDEVQCVNWRTGISTVYDEDLGNYYVFVAPPVEGWTFVVGLALPHPLGQRFVDNCLPLLDRLARQFDEVQYFFSYPLIEHYAWARYQGGDLKRAFAWGDEGALWNKGSVTQSERDLGLKVFELRRLGGRGRAQNDNDIDEDAGYPSEKHVLAMAEEWSLNPTRIDRLTIDPALGHVGQVSPEWHVRRLKAHLEKRRGGKRAAALQPAG